MSFKCKRGHIFKRRPNEILHKNKWCGRCQLSYSKIIEEIDKDGNIINEYNGLKDIIESNKSNNKIISTNITSVLKGRAKSAYKRFFRYKKE